MSTLARAVSWFLQPAAQGPAEPPRPATPADVTSAAVLGRPGEAEPVAAGLALAISRRARTRAATVALLAAPPRPAPAGRAVHERPGGGWAPPAPTAADLAPPGGRWSPPAPAAADSAPPGGRWSPPAPAAVDSASPEGRWAPLDGGSSPPATVDATPPGTEASVAPGGSRAARRLVTRLGARGLPARARGRLAWVELSAAGGPAAARRAVVAGAPAVLAVTAPRTAEIDAVVAEQDLVVLVAVEPDGPLARLASPPAGGPPLVILRPLRRGPARSLACAGLAAPRELRALVAADEGHRS
jgi:hypothetical protein